MEKLFEALKYLTTEHQEHFTTRFFSIDSAHVTMTNYPVPGSNLHPVFVLRVTPEGTLAGAVHINQCSHTVCRHIDDLEPSEIIDRCMATIQRVLSRSKAHDQQFLTMVDDMRNSL